MQLKASHCSVDENIWKSMPRRSRDHSTYSLMFKTPRRFRFLKSKIILYLLIFIEISRYQSLFNLLREVLTRKLKKLYKNISVQKKPQLWMKSFRNSKWPQNLLSKFIFVYHVYKTLTLFQWQLYHMTEADTERFSDSRKKSLNIF